MALFNVKSFIKECKEFDGDPLKYFENLDRDMPYKTLMLNYVNRRFRTIKEDYIREVLRRSNFNLIVAETDLNHPPNDMILISESCLESDTDANFLNSTDWPAAFRREVDFFEHKTEIIQYLNGAKLKKSNAINEGQYFSCECCWADDVLMDEVIACRGGHIFCADCIMKHVQTTAEEGRLEFKCLFFQFCNGSFLRCLLEKLISPAEIERLQNESQLQGIRRAEIPGLQHCPLCNYAAVLEEKDTFFSCQKCRVVTCRKCKLAHDANEPCPMAQAEQPRVPPRLELPLCQILPAQVASGVAPIAPVEDDYHEVEDYDDFDDVVPDYYDDDDDEMDDEVDAYEGMDPDDEEDPDYYDWMDDDEEGDSDEGEEEEEGVAGNVNADTGPGEEASGEDENLDDEYDESDSDEEWDENDSSEFSDDDLLEGGDDGSDDNGSDAMDDNDVDYVPGVEELQNDADPDPIDHYIEDLLDGHEDDNYFDLDDDNDNYCSDYSYYDDDNNDYDYDD